jgi:hypothetical protein
MSKTTSGLHKNPDTAVAFVSKPPFDMNVVQAKLRKTSVRCGVQVVQKKANHSSSSFEYEEEFPLDNQTLLSQSALPKKQGE